MTPQKERLAFLKDIENKKNTAFEANFYEITNLLKEYMQAEIREIKFKIAHEKYLQKLISRDLKN